jgi:lipopolysaccharide/colanic/teichoic acid biosynthesis glycosyltransferase
MIEPISRPTIDTDRVAWPPRRTRWKRVVDVLLGGLLLIALAPLMAIIALCVCLDSAGPPLYRQQRIGRAGKPFTMWKFRSMHHASCEDPHRQQAHNWFHNAPAAHGFKNERDPRITHIGWLLRTTSLDELPQLFNVIRGEMSLVGPRPMMPYDRPEYEPWYFEREAVRPGITGLWQVSGRDQLSAPAMMALDIRYVREWCLWLDFKILFLTFPSVVDHARDRQRVVLTADAQPSPLAGHQTLS